MTAFVFSTSVENRLTSPQSAAALAKAENRKLTRKFVNFLLHPERSEGSKN